MVQLYKLVPKEKVNNRFGKVRIKVPARPDFLKRHPKVNKERVLVFLRT